MTTILGICTYHGDASAVLVEGGELVAAVEEERFRRIKHWAGFPARSVEKVLEVGGVEAEEVDTFAVGRDPRANMPKRILFTVRNLPSPGLVWDRVRNRSKLNNLPKDIGNLLELDPDVVDERLEWVEHHPAHLASTFFVSPFEEAAVCAVDGFGDFVSTSTAIGQGNDLERLSEVYYPHSLGIVYKAVTQFLGFHRYGAEYKVMGLAAYAEPTYAEQVRNLVPLRPDGTFELNLDYFRHWTDDVDFNWEDGAPTMGPVYTEAMEDLLGPVRGSGDELTDRHKEIAGSVQHVFEQTLFHVLENLHEETGLDRVCLAGGTAMNSVANGKVRANTPFDEIFVQPAAADNGTSLGAAYHVWNQQMDRPRNFEMDHVFYGPRFDDDAILDALDAFDGEIQRQDCTLERIEDDDILLPRVAEAIADGDVVGWFQGRMEYAARALGNRSILADPRRENMRQIINDRIKYREEFRPFAPSLLDEALDEYFVDAVPDPFMIQVYPVRPDKREEIPAVTHVDGTGRMQTVHRETNPRYWDLIKSFEKETGTPVVLNTSFNESEPIVNTPEEALDCFLRTDMDAVVLEDRLVRKG